MCGAQSTESGKVADHEAWITRIRHAFENDMFSLLFQPIISLRGDSDEHYEVFLRMIDTQDNQMRPAEFLQTAIEHNVAGKIDRWVSLQSIKMLSGHRAKGHNTRLTINVVTRIQRSSEPASSVATRCSGPMQSGPTGKDSLRSGPTSLPPDSSLPPAASVSNRNGE